MNIFPYLLKWKYY